MVVPLAHLFDQLVALSGQLVAACCQLVNASLCGQQIVQLGACGRLRLRLRLIVAGTAAARLQTVLDIAQLVPQAQELLL